MNTGSLHEAVKAGDLEKVKALLKDNPDLVLSRNEMGGGTPLHCALLRDETDVLKFLLANNAEVDAKDDMSETPLHLAAILGHKEVAELLLANKAEVNAKDGLCGRPPLHHATQEGYRDVAELLRKHGGSE